MKIAVKGTQFISKITGMPLFWASMVGTLAGAGIALGLHALAVPTAITVLVAFQAALFVGYGRRLAMDDIEKKAFEKLSAVVDKHRAELMSIPGVVAVKGKSVPDGDFNDHYILVELTKLDADILDRIPKSIEGYRVQTKIVRTKGDGLNSYAAHFSKNTATFDESLKESDALAQEGHRARALLLELKRGLSQVPGAEFGAYWDKNAATYWLFVHDKKKSLPAPKPKPAEPQQQEAQPEGPVHDVFNPKKVGVAAKWVTVKAGTFQMGSAATEDGHQNDEVPHQVTLTHKTEWQAAPVTQGQYLALMRRNPSNFKAPEHADGDNKTINGESHNVNHPVEKVSFYDALEYLNELSKVKKLKPVYILDSIQRDAEGSITSAAVRINGPSVYETEGYKDGKNGYRLPTEAEWEKAAKEGEAAGGEAWHSGNSGQRTHAVDTLQADSLGLRHMKGNVWEWVWDWYAAYPTGAATDPTGPATGSDRVFRGGSWYTVARHLRSARRSYVGPSARFDIVGLRPVRSIR